MMHEDAWFEAGVFLYFFGVLSGICPDPTSQICSISFQWKQRIADAEVTAHSQW
jgi:hypothetical protein